MRLSDGRRTNTAACGIQTKLPSERHFIWPSYRLFFKEWDPYDLDEDEIKNRLLKVLHKVDIDNDGQLSKNELVKHIHKALYAMDEEEAEDEFIDADIDGDDRGIFS